MFVLMNTIIFDDDNDSMLSFFITFAHQLMSKQLSFKIYQTLHYININILLTPQSFWVSFSTYCWKKVWKYQIWHRCVTQVWDTTVQLYTTVQYNCTTVRNKCVIQLYNCTQLYDFRDTTIRIWLILIISIHHDCKLMQIHAVIGMNPTIFCHLILNPSILLFYKSI